MSRKLLVSAAAATLLLGIAACGDDDDAESADSTAPAATDAPATTQPGDAAAATDDVAAFCEAEIGVEAAVSSEDPTAIEPAFAALGAAAPADIKATVDTAVTEAQKFVAEEGEPSPEFETAYAEVMTYMKDNCGYTDLALTATEYEFGGVPSEVPAGGAVITLENIGKEFHELALMRINDDVTETVDELLALPEEEAQSKVQNVAGTFAAPDSTSYTAAELTPGRYVVMCFLPEGFTPEVMAQVETGGTEPEGQPHVMLGMVHEFTVA